MKKKISSEEPKKKKNHIRKCIHILIKILDNIIAKIVYILIFAIFLAFIYKENNKFITLMNITERENYTIKTKAKRKGREYLNKCLEGKLINNRIFKLSENPKVTIIIPLYNTGKRIKLIIRSIQNQNIEDIEIILVNDFSKDNTLEIIEKLKEEDPRITIINNSKNMGVLYSRSVGVLQAKGEYITNLDHDDFIFDEDVFDTAYKASENGKFDIIAFMHFNSPSYYSKIEDIKSVSSLIPHNKTVYQPELSVFTQFGDDGFNFYDYRIWEKFFKNNVYKKAVNALTYERYSQFSVYSEDLIGLFAICNVAESYKFIRKYGVFHLFDENTSSKAAKYIPEMLSEILFSDVIISLGKNQYKKYAAIFLENRVDLSSEKNNKFLKQVLNKIMKCQYIEEKYKEKLKKKFPTLLTNFK